MDDERPAGADFGAGRPQLYAARRGRGTCFYLLPDAGRAAEQGLGNVITAAMNQSFFTLSLGIGAIEIFGSYMDRRFTLPGEAARICVLDTFVAVCAG